MAKTPPINEERIAALERLAGTAGPRARSYADLLRDFNTRHDGVVEGSQLEPQTFADLVRLFESRPPKAERQPENSRSVPAEKLPEEVITGRDDSPPVASTSDAARETADRDDYAREPPLGEFPRHSWFRHIGGVYLETPEDFVTCLEENRKRERRLQKRFKRGRAL